MKTIPKRPDLFTNPALENETAEQQISQLLSIRSIMNSKFSLLTQKISNDVAAFVQKNYPHKIGDLTLKPQINLFGTQKNFSLFSTEIKQLLFQMQFEVKEVVEALQKFSFTKNISLLITDGIMKNFLKLTHLMVTRQSFCNNLMSEIQRNVQEGSGIFSRKFQQNTICSRCLSLISRENVNFTKELMLEGFPQSIKPIEQRVQQDYYNFQSDQDKEQIGWKSQQHKKSYKMAKKNNQNVGTQLMSEEIIKYNLQKLQNRLEQRKNDILASLHEIGRFSSSVIKSSQNLIHDKQFLDQIPLPPPSIDIFPPKFDYKKFAFSLSKYFYKEIKEIEAEITGIKSKYKTIIANHLEKQQCKEVQCDLGKDFFDKQMQKYNKKTERKINALNFRIKEIEEIKKNYKTKIDQFQNVVKIHLNSRIDEETYQVDKITIEKKISKLVDKYEKTIKQQQKQLEKYIEAERIIQKAQINRNPIDKLTPQLPAQKVINSGETKEINNKQNIISKNKEKTLNSKKKTLDFIQPLIKKLNDKSPKDLMTNKSSSSLIGSGQKPTIYFQNPNINITSFTNFSLTNKEIYQAQTFKKNDGNLKICSKVFQASVQFKSNEQKKLNPHISSKNPRKLSKTFHPQIVQIMSMQQQSEIKKQDQIWKSQTLNLKKRHKLPKVKSQQITKIYKLDSLCEDKSITKLPKKSEATINIMKRYSSEHLANPLKHKASYFGNINSNQKPNKKAQKTFSLKIMKKNQNYEPNCKSSFKLPSLSLQQKSLDKTQKLKQLQKLPENNKNNLLSKKKRKKRNFSQQTVLMGCLFRNKNLTMSLGSNPDKVQKQKNKKQYIIDFIPKIEEQSVSKCKQNDFSSIQTQIEDMFNTTLVEKIASKSQINKGKYLAKTFLNKIDENEIACQKLKIEEISLSTLIYSSMARIKLLDHAVYRSIRQKLQRQYKKRQKIKNNCDQISISTDIAEQKSKFPVLLQVDPSSSYVIESSCYNKNQIQQTISTKSNEMDTQNRQKKEIKNTPIIEKETWFKNVINYLILKHRKSCQPNKTILAPLRSSDIRTCEHLYNFYQSLVDIINQRQNFLQGNNQK